MSELNTKLMGALVKAQAEMGRALKDSANPFFKSKYADLTSVDGAIREVAGKHGLGYIQVSHDKDNEAAIETVIVHESGETFSCGIVAVPVAKHDAQGFGSAMTYARRYSLSAAFGVCPEDDDGNAAAKSKQKSAVNEEQEKFLLDHKIIMDDLIKEGNYEGAARHFYITSKLDQEEQAELWGKFASNHRTEMKKFKPEQLQKAA